MKKGYLLSFITSIIFLVFVSQIFLHVSNAQQPQRKTRKQIEDENAKIAQDRLARLDLEKQAKAEARKAFENYFLAYGNDWITKAKVVPNPYEGDRRKPITKYGFAIFRNVEGFESVEFRELQGSEKYNNPAIEMEAKFYIRAESVRYISYEGDDYSVNYNRKKESDWKDAKLSIQFTLRKQKLLGWSVFKKELGDYAYNPYSNSLSLKFDGIIKPTADEVRTLLPKEAIEGDRSTELGANNSPPVTGNNEPWEESSTYLPSLYTDDTPLYREKAKINFNKDIASLFSCVGEQTFITAISNDGKHHVFVLSSPYVASRKIDSSSKSRYIATVAISGSLVTENIISGFKTLAVSREEYINRTPTLLVTITRATKSGSLIELSVKSEYSDAFIAYKENSCGDVTEVMRLPKKRAMQIEPPKVSLDPTKIITDYFSQCDQLPGANDNWFAVVNERELIEVMSIEIKNASSSDQSQRYVIYGTGYRVHGTDKNFIYTKNPILSFSVEVVNKEFTVKGVSWINSATTISLRKPSNCAEVKRFKTSIGSVFK